MKSLFVLLSMVLCFSTISLQAQGEISGEVENWSNVEAKIIFVDIFG